jgi:hypothetical protein
MHPPQSRRWILAALVASLLPLAACSQHDSHAAHGEHPAQVDKIDGSALSRVTLTERAAERIGLETVTVLEEEVDGSVQKVVPYSSLIYDPQGGIWIYTSPQARTFVRVQVEVDRIDGDRVFLSEGPAAGTEIASVGVTQIYGAETGVGH